MKALAAGLVVGVVFLSPFLLAGAGMMLASSSDAVRTAASAGSCLTDADTAEITDQAARILDGAPGTNIRIEGLDLPDEQVPHAATIVATGRSLNVPAKGQVIALATALQESRLRNLTYGDRDSLGLFQQRPSQGWGTAQQIRDPVYAAEQFYQRLLTVDGWQQMTTTQAAQAVQKSAYPDAYAQWEDLATALQAAVTATFPRAGDDERSADPDSFAGGTGCAGEPDGSGFGPIPEGSIPNGYRIPPDADPKARTAIGWAMRQLGTLYQWGGSCTDAHGPDPMGRCDCSSLMQQAYAHAGITLTRTTYTQINEGKPVPRHRLRPGDLIFSRGTAARPEHVGMYMGQGLVIEAPRTGKPVRITPLADWTVLAVRRVL
ncbi:C40 family peptidase [Streptomyces phytophilus]|uniref:C40 family peptidase n=1 Tax=Streptomyces phytophilus TaxID=722715 RepID=UPI0015F11BC1|nr:C40 family peptidase [Streptomyces phytophilus]